MQRGYGCVHIDGDISLARQLLKHLEEEGFVKAVMTTVDEFGTTIEAKSKNTRGKDKKGKGKKNVQKTRYAFNKQIKNTKKYKDYFTPEQEVESRMLGLDDYVSIAQGLPYASLTMLFSGSSETRMTTDSLRLFGR